MRYGFEGRPLRPAFRSITVRSRVVVTEYELDLLFPFDRPKTFYRVVVRFDRLIPCAVRWCGCGRCGRHDSALWRVCAAECAGAALLVLLTCLAGAGAAGAASPAYRALASGLVVTVLVQSLDHISGAQMNPAVTLAAALWGRVSRRRAGAMALAQLAGAALGAAGLRALAPPAALALCVTSPQVAPAQALAVEALLGGCLALANCASWDARVARLRDSWPLRIGLSVAALSLVGCELTGASMNPARSLGPALCSGRWAHHWVYWLGPLGGSALFTGAYVYLWRPAPPACPAPPARPALPGKPHHSV